MPEYLALVHHRSQADKPEGEAPEWTADELNAAFARMERSGVAKVTH